MEVAVDSLPGALIAVESGAGRLELCASLDGGGVTPSIGLLESVLGRVSVPVMVLVRPRTGGFVYGPDEQAIVTRDIRSLVGAGAAGVVVGALDPESGLDLGALDAWLDEAAGAPVTFHRAFDCCRDLRLAHRQLVERGVQRVLTAGGTGRALDGLQLLAELAAHGASSEAGAILPGGGLRAAHVTQVLAATGGSEVHTSGRTDASAVLPGSGEYPGLTMPDPAELVAMARALGE